MITIGHKQELIKLTL